MATTHAGPAGGTKAGSTANAASPTSLQEARRLGRIVFADVARHDKVARDAAEERESMLRQRLVEDKTLPPELKKELAALEILIKKDPPDTGEYVKATVDPLFFGLRDALATMNPDMGDVGEPRKGKFPGLTDRKESTFAAIYGLLTVDNQTPRDFKWTVDDHGDLKFETDDTHFKKAVAAALGEYSANAALFHETLSIIALEGGGTDEKGGGTLDAGKWANVVRKLRFRGINADHPNLPLIAAELLSGEIGGTEDAAPSSIELSFPDIEEGSDIRLIKNNIMAMHIFYPSWMLDEARFYDVYEKIEELFLNQMLPISRGSAGDRIFARWKKSTQRISKPERLNFYATCFGASTGNPALTNQNKEFGDLWLRFVSGVSEFGRKLQVDELLRTRLPLSVSTEQVRKSARDLAANLSLHGYGVAYFAAAELQTEINEIKDILSDEEVRMAYGARDMRQLIEQVSIYELGGARDVTRYFTMATAGAVIIRWLANKAADLSGPYMRPILDINVVRKDTARSSSVKATSNPTDRDLVDACEQWLAVTGTPDERVTEFAQPNETPAMTSRPIAIPQVAKDLLDSVGVSAGMGRPNGGTGGRSSRFAPR
jgi:hypothetical protein